MKKIFLIILLFTLKSFSQEIVSNDDIYLIDNLAYKKSDSKLFTGKIQKFKNNDHLKYEVEFEQGILKKNTLYFNGKEKIIAEETYYFYKTLKVEKKITYSLDHTMLWIKHYDLSENLKLDEIYENDILIYTCSYLNNKKQGVQFSIDKKGVKHECFYENGKRIKK
jgi:antitoxin component YwqK of YwqJK toxin-antitoxin module